MHPHSHFAATASLHLHALISDLHRRVRMLGSDIQEEERKAGNPDPASLSYPMLALDLRARRANLHDTMATRSNANLSVTRVSRWRGRPKPHRPISSRSKISYAISGWWTGFFIWNPLSPAASYL